MLIHELINTDLEPLRSDDTVKSALNKLHLYSATHYPVTDGNMLAGNISLNELLDAESDTLLLSDTPLEDPVSLNYEQHVLEAVRTFSAVDLRLIPVTDEKDRLLGLVDKQDVHQAVHMIFNLDTPGSVIIIEIHPYDYTLSEIVRLIETEGAKIMGIGSQLPTNEHQYYRVSVKLDVSDSSAVSTALQRFGYVVSSEFSSVKLESDISDRADELIRYLDI